MTKKKDRRRHTHYRMGGWVAPALPLNDVQFTGTSTPPGDSTPADGAATAGDAGASV